MLEIGQVRECVLTNEVKQSVAFPLPSLGLRPAQGFIPGLRFTLPLGAAACKSPSRRQFIIHQQINEPAEMSRIYPA